MPAPPLTRPAGRPDGAGDPTSGDLRQTAASGGLRLHMPTNRALCVLLAQAAFSLIWRRPRQDSNLRHTAGVPPGRGGASDRPADFHRCRPKIRLPGQAHGRTPVEQPERKRSAAKRDEALRMVGAGVAVNRVAQDLGISPVTLQSWISAEQARQERAKHGNPDAAPHSAGVRRRSTSGRGCFTRIPVLIRQRFVARQPPLYSHPGRKEASHSPCLPYGHRPSKSSEAPSTTTGHPRAFRQGRVGFQASVSVARSTCRLSSWSGPRRPAGAVHLDISFTSSVRSVQRCLPAYVTSGIRPWVTVAGCHGPGSLLSPAPRHTV